MPGDLGGVLELGGVAAVELAASALSARGKPLPNCANCGAPVIDEFCAVCGQERNTHRRSVKGLLHELFSEIVNLDSRILRTMVALLLKPGELALAFREGRTRRYIPALRLYLFVSLLFFLALSVTGLAIIQLRLVTIEDVVNYDAHGNAFIKNPGFNPNDGDPYEKPVVRIPKDHITAAGKHYSFSTQAFFFAPVGGHRTALSKDERKSLSTLEKMLGPGSHASETAARPARPDHAGDSFKKKIYDGIERIAADPAALNGPLTTWIPRALFLLMPLYALLLALFYLRHRRDFYLVDHVIFSLTIHTFLFVALLIAAGLAQLLSGSAVAWLFFCAMGVYTFLAMKKFYAQGWVWTTVKFTAVSFIYVCFFLFPALGGVLALSFFGGSFG